MSCLTLSYIWANRYVTRPPNTIVHSITHICNRKTHDMTNASCVCVDMQSKHIELETASTCVSRSATTRSTCPKFRVCSVSSSAGSWCKCINCIKQFKEFGLEHWNVSAVQSTMYPGRRRLVIDNDRKNDYSRSARSAQTRTLARRTNFLSLFWWRHNERTLNETNKKPWNSFPYFQRTTDKKWIIFCFFFFRFFGAKLRKIVETTHSFT